MYPKTLGELHASRFAADHIRTRSVKDELRDNLLRRMRSREPLISGVLGYEETVLPQVANAILSRHNFILLGLRGQAKSRILRGLSGLLDEVAPFIAGCEIRDNPFAPICGRCRRLILEAGGSTPIDYLTPHDRFVEKLATPDVTIADIIGDVDPIKAAKGGFALGSDMSIHYGLLPRANRGIFAINELPDLAGKIQVGLFNIMQEGDVQIKGYPIRLPLDVCLVFSANPEDYTARGKIVTPLKDRIGSEIRTHYPSTIELSMEITRQEAWADRPGPGILIPQFVREVVEAIAFRARSDSRVDRKSGVSQRLPISCLENVISNAERRAARHDSTDEVARIADIYSALPAITGKIELEYEGELRGGEVVASDLIRQGVQVVFRHHFQVANLSRTIDWFDRGGSLRISDQEKPVDALLQLAAVDGLLDAILPIDIDPSTDAFQVSAAEFILEGLHALDKIARSDERGFVAAERKVPSDLHRDHGPDRPRYKKPLN